jgi:alpha-ribazole phosphatase/probable phosphoglycerate mutase
MIRLFLIRHGDTADEETKKIYKGSIDIPLSEKGVERIKKASSFLSSFKIEAVYTSTLSRSIESGRIIAEPHGIDIALEKDLDEIHFGSWEGLSFDEIREKYPEHLTRWLRDPVNNTPPLGEPFRNAQKRSVKKLKEILKSRDGQTVAVVVHGGILRVLILSLLRLRLSGLFRISQDYGCINIVDIFSDGNVTIKLLNFTYY